MHRKTKSAEDELTLKDLVSDRWVNYGGTLWVLQMRDTLSTVHLLDDSGKYSWEVVDGPRFVASGIADSEFDAQVMAEKCMPGWTSSATPEQIARARRNMRPILDPESPFFNIPESIKKARTAGSGCAYLFFILGIVSLVAPATIQGMPMGIYQVLYVIMCGFMLMAGGYEWYRAKVMASYALGEETAGTIFKMTTVLGTICGIVAFCIGLFLLKVGQDALATASVDMQPSVQVSIYLSMFLVACTVFTLAMVVISRVIYHNAMREITEAEALEEERAGGDDENLDVSDVELAVAAKKKAEAAAKAAKVATDAETGPLKAVPGANAATSKTAD